MEQPYWRLTLLQLRSSARRIRLALPMLGFVLAPAQALGAEALIGVAANFNSAARELAKHFQSRTDHSVNLSFGSTGKLYAQIAHGAPYDVLMAADAERPIRAIDAGFAVTGSRFTYALGRLVLWSPESGLFRNGEDYLRQGQFQRLAIANPQTAPYGLAAKQTLTNLGVWESVAPRLVRGESVAQAFQFVATGNVESGLVALAQLPDTAESGSPGSRWLVPESLFEPIAQQAVLLERGMSNPAAQAWLSYLKRPEAVAIIRRHGYGVNSRP
ncbi:MAG: molybdate ABC transporter substrate-binding protein [Oleiphilaceae bacterium]|nr:molybdate ABC transporter substrate-binding protein [Oleiphilaceae bacterium]